MGSHPAKNFGRGAGYADSSATEAAADAGGIRVTSFSTDSAGAAAGSASSAPRSAGQPSAGAVGVESVGLVGGTDELIAQAEAAAATVPNIDPATGEAQPADLNPNGQWTALTPPAVEVLCAVVLPAWQIQQAEQRPVSEALAECLDQVFPGGIEGKYACWVRLMFACGAITVSRVAQNGGRLPPLFLPKSTPKSTAPTPTA